MTFANIRIYCYFSTLHMFISTYHHTEQNSQKEMCWCLVPWFMHVQLKHPIITEEGRAPYPTKLPSQIAPDQEQHQSPSCAEKRGYKH